MDTAAREAANRIMARKMLPTGTNLPMDVETVARAVLNDAGEVERLRHALTAFIHAYANTKQLDRDNTEIELFKAWLEGCGALGIQCTPPERRPVERPS